MYEKKIAEMLAKRGLTPEIDCPNIKGRDGSGNVQISIDEGLSTIVIHELINNRFIKTYVNGISELSLYLDI